MMTENYFNSQPHKEADLTKPEYVPIIEHFNSQPHKEADQSLRAIRADYSISTHSLTRRLTVDAKEARKLRKAFQLTASQGG